MSGCKVHRKKNEDRRIIRKRKWWRHQWSGEQKQIEDKEKKGGRGLKNTTMNNNVKYMGPSPKMNIKK